MTTDQHHSFVAETILASPWHLDALKTVRALGLPDWAIGAGFVRNAVWDRLHGYAAMTPLNDIDVLYFDSVSATVDHDIAIEARLFAADAARPWSVHNQARMHIRNHDAPYRSTADAIAFWLETPTGVAVHLSPDDTLTVIAPFGLTDLIEMRSAPTAAGLARPEWYARRMKEKDWAAVWPKVQVVGVGASVVGAFGPLP